jgi:hypothetical protein
MAGEPRLWRRFGQAWHHSDLGATSRSLGNQTGSRTAEEYQLPRVNAEQVSDWRYTLSRCVTERMRNAFSNLQVGESY